jgi:hypothetical protein
MMKHIKGIIAWLAIVIAGVSCNVPSERTQEESPLSEISVQPVQVQPPAGELAELPSYQLLTPEDFIYRGFFRLPEPSGGSNWDYSGHGLTYFPEGDPAGEPDGFPGSLFGFGHDQQLLVSEISIPEPIISAALEEAHTAVTLQPFSDVTGGLLQAEQKDIPRAGLEYLAEPEPRLHFCYGQHFQDFEASHGWASLDLQDPQVQGPWVFDGYTNYVTNDYLFEIPPSWAGAISPGTLLASGRAREGPWSGRGPALFAYPVPEAGMVPAPGDSLQGILPLLLYGEQLPGETDILSDPSQAVQDYTDADHWWGGAWITRGDKAGVVLAGTKGLGKAWYGFANGLVWEYDCAEQTPPTCPDPPEWPYENRGYWAEGYQAQLIFYDPAQLVAVARGELDSWQPQPYAVMVLDGYLLDPEIDLGEYKRDLVGAAAFDREHGYFFLVERLADEYRSVIHVWEIVP